MHGAALPVPIFVGLHFLLTGVFPDGLLHALCLPASAPSSRLSVLRRVAKLRARGSAGRRPKRPE
jgi:hypothetical protein